MTFIKNASVALASLSVMLPAGQVIANENFDINNMSQGADSSMAQVNSVFQLRDVAPSDWAFDALRNLVEKYNCIVGYPDGTYRGGRPLSRYEFAAGLNSCMQQIEKMVLGGDAPDAADITTLRSLVQEFEAELATLGARVDDLEGRVEFLEDNQFSTTTKLVGETAFVVADAFGDSTESQTVFHNKVRLQLVTSFTGKDKLYTRLTAGNSGTSFTGTDGADTFEGRFSYDGTAGNDVIIDRLHYVFPVGKKTTVTTMARLGAHHFYSDTFNKGLEAGGGASGALSRFAERNPIYRLGIGGPTTGIGVKHNFNDTFQLSAGYLAKGGSDSSEGNGLFNGSYSALAQLAIKPSDKIKFGLAYVHGFNTERGNFNFGGTGTGFANTLDSADGTASIGDDGLTSNSFGLQGQFDISSKFSLRAWGGYTDVDAIGAGGDAEIWNYAVAAVFPDLGKKGNMGALIIGAEPYATELTDAAGADLLAGSNDTPWHIEGLYKYQLTKNISITPGIIWLTAPNQDNGNSDIVIGAIRTTFKF